MLLTVAAVLAKVGDHPPLGAAFPCADIHAREVLGLGRAVDELAWAGLFGQVAAHLEVLHDVRFILRVRDGLDRLREYVCVGLKVLDPYGVVKGRGWRLEDVRGGWSALSEADVRAEIELADLGAAVTRSIRGSRAEQAFLLPAQRAVNAASARSESVGSFVGGYQGLR